MGFKAYNIIPNTKPIYECGLINFFLLLYSYSLSSCPPSFPFPTKINYLLNTKTICCIIYCGKGKGGKEAIKNRNIYLLSAQIINRFSVRKDGNIAMRFTSIESLNIFVFLFLFHGISFSLLFWPWNKEEHTKK